MRGEQGQRVGPGVLFPAAGRGRGRGAEPAGLQAVPAGDAAAVPVPRPGADGVPVRGPDVPADRRGAPHPVRLRPGRRPRGVRAAVHHPPRRQAQPRPRQLLQPLRLLPQGPAVRPQGPLHHQVPRRRPREELLGPLCQGHVRPHGGRRRPPGERHRRPRWRRPRLSESPEPRSPGRSAEGRPGKIHGKKLWVEN